MLHWLDLIYVCIVRRAKNEHKKLQHSFGNFYIIFCSFVHSNFLFCSKIFDISISFHVIYKWRRYRWKNNFFKPNRNGEIIPHECSQTHLYGDAWREVAIIFANYEQNTCFLFNFKIYLRTYHFFFCLFHNIQYI